MQQLLKWRFDSIGWSFSYVDSVEMKAHKQRARSQNNEKELKAGNQTENKKNIK